MALYRLPNDPKAAYRDEIAFHQFVTFRIRFVTPLTFVSKMRP